MINCPKLSHFSPILLPFPTNFIRFLECIFGHFSQFPISPHFAAIFPFSPCFRAPAASQLIRLQLVQMLGWAAVCCDALHSTAFARGACAPSARAIFVQPFCCRCNP